jgi:UDP-glucuronate decarboxylase
MPIFGDGTAGRDMLYIDDAVVGLLRVLDRPAPWRVLNLGSGQTTTLAQVAEQICAGADVVLRLETRPLRAGEMPNTWADMATCDLLGFQPTIALADGLRRTAAWWNQRPEPFRT